MALSGRRERVNAPLAFAAGVLMILAETLLHPAIILVFFVSRLTDSLQAYALVIAIGQLGWFLPQLVVPWLTGSAARRMPWALGASIVRAASIAFLAYLAHRDDVTNHERLRSFFICYLAYSVASGFAQTPIGELLGRSLAGNRAGAVMRQRNWWGMVLAVGAGLVARQSLGAGGPAFPRNVSLLFVASAAAMAGATFFLARLDEPVIPPSRGDHRGIPAAADLLRVAGDGALRRFVFVGMLAAISTLADPFFVVYAQRSFKLPADMVGSFLAIFAAGVLLSSPLWTAIERGGGARGVLQSAITVRLIAPLAALLIPYLIDTQLYRDHVHNPRAIFYLLAIPFGALGVAARGFAVGNARYLAEISLPRRRTAYQIVALTPMLVAAAAPFAGARVIEQWGFDRLFLAAVFASLLAVLCAGLLANTSMRVRGVSRAWRLRGARP